MRQGRRLIWGLWAGLVGGCLAGEPARPTSVTEHFSPLERPAIANAIYMQTALLEAPVGDRYLNKDLWNQADDLVLTVDQKGLLEDNGFCVGQVGGVTPPEFLARLTSERSCVNAKLHQAPLDTPVAINLGPPLAKCQFKIERDSGRTPVDVEDAQCRMEIVPSTAPDGRTRLRFTPLVQHGKPGQFYQPTADRSGFMLNDQRPIERYTALAWEVTLALNEYAVVGACYDKPDTLGARCFVRTDEQLPRQRLLVVRTCRPVAGVALDDGLIDGGEPPWSGRSLPLAVQALLSAPASRSRSE
jgi:hypothetical protein